MGNKAGRFFKGYIGAFFMFPADSIRFYLLVNIGGIGRLSVAKCCDENSDFGM